MKMGKIKFICDFFLAIAYRPDQMFTKVRQQFLTITLNVVVKFPSNFASRISYKYLTMWHKNYPLHLMHVCTLPCIVMRVIDNNSVITCYCYRKPEE